MRVFLDANILFSACRSAGAVRELLRLLEAGGHVMVVDGYVAHEARRNLMAKGAPDSVALLEALLARTSHLAHHARGAGATSSTIDLSWLPSKDQPVLAAAVALGCDVLVTGDKSHFGSAYGTVVGEVRICSPTQLFELLQQSRGTS